MGKNRKNKGKGGKKAGFVSRNALVLVMAGLAIVAMVGVAGVFALRPYGGEDAWVVIPEGATSDAIADSLALRLGEGHGRSVHWFWKLAGGKEGRARGRYRIPRGQLSAVTAWKLRGGMQTPVRVQWNDVRTMEQLAEKVSQKMEFTASDFLAACDSVLLAEGFEREEYPAAFLPDSYEFYSTDSAVKTVRKLLKHRNAFWNKKRRGEARDLGLTPMQVQTLASIVEEESANADELPVIARLYLNRIDRGMPLQADPTVKFATGDFGLKRITSAHLRIESPYNTYLHKGLPPGPIRVASKRGIEAVLNAPEHSYLYMCAKEDFSGRHDFAETYAEHQANARRYRAELDRRGIK